MTEPNATVPPLTPLSETEPQRSFTDRLGVAGAWVNKRKVYVAIAVIAVLLAVFWVSTEDINPSTDDAQVDGHAIVISSRVSGYVERMNIDDNTAVKTGDLMIQLDPADYQARVDQARAALTVAQARAASLKITVPFTVGTTSSATSAAEAQVTADQADLATATATYDRLSISELKFAEANVAARRAEMDKADMDIKRTQSLAEQSEISHQQYDAYVAVAQVKQNDWIAATQRLEATRREAEAAKDKEASARASVVRAQAQVRESKAQELQSGVRKADYQSALADVQEAQAALDQALLNLRYTQLRAPMNSMVTKRTVEAGQQFAAGQAMFVLVPLDKIWVTANFKETQMAHVRTGQHVRIRIDAYDGKSFDGVVDSIASSTGSREALLPPENATGNFVKVVQRIPVKILIDRNSDSAAVLRPGMNVEVKIRTSAWML